MPIQHTIGGRPITLRIPPRRIQVTFSIFALIIIVILLAGLPTSVSRPSVPRLPTSIGTPKLPKFSSINPFGQSAHKPPVQANSTSGEASWFSDWKWRNPFSSSITLDDNRAVLPPLKTRPPVYTFYEPSPKKDKLIRDAEDKLILIWRRAWWAQGFKPVVLGRPEAMNNPLYEKLQRLQLDDALENEIARWLAWGNMGTGILTNYLAVPMAPYGDDLLSYLRRGEYPKLIRYEGLQSGMFCGEKTAINEAIKEALDNPDIKKALSMIDAVHPDTFTMDADHNSVAYYDRNTIIKSYKTVAEKFQDHQEAAGLNLLAELINAHLHTTWQNTFSSGVAVLKPLPTHMTALVEPAVEIACNLSQCPMSSLPVSCPPNRPKCKPCVSSPMRLTTASNFRNISTLFNIGTVPHPYTTTSLHYQKVDVSPRFVRRLEYKSRDQWLFATTNELLGSGVAGPVRIVRFKEAVASEYGTSHSLWLTAERESHKDLDWIFGFALPRNASSRGESETPVPGPERRPPPPEPEGPMPTAEELEKERELLRKAREAVRSKARPQVVVREAVEAWNMADTEAWRFARAFSARRRVERLKWEEEEQKYAGAESRTAGWGRWFDRGR